MPAHPGIGPPTDRAEGEEQPTLTVGAASRPAPRLARGSSVGRYVVLDPIGSGGMGIVYAAYDPDLERKVALKLFSVPAGPPPSPALLREAKALARLAHPNVLTIHDAGIVGDMVFLACELVDGVSLDRWLIAGRRRRAAVLGTLLAAGRGLAAAHAAGIVHGDFKPANVMVAGDGRVLVVDFGLAQVAAAHSDGEGSVLSLSHLDGGAHPVADAADSGARAGGTPGYMAPEQLAGGPASPASDQYAFCVVVAEALAPSSAASGTAAPPPLPRRPASLRRALERGLDPDPERRHPSTDALLAVLGRRPWPRRPQTLVAALALLSLAAAFALHRPESELPAACSGSEALVAEVWGAPHRARLGSLSPAAGAAAATRALDAWAASWSRMHRAACLATAAGTQSPALLDLRMACLEERRQELAAILALLERDRPSADRAAEAVHALAPLTRCADTSALLAAVPPPDAPVAAEVTRVRRDLRSAVAQEHLGRYADAATAATRLAAEAEPLGYWPLTAEVLLRQGLLEARNGDRGAADTLARAVDAAVAGGDDRTAAEALVHLVRVHAYQLADHQRARYYARLAAAALARLGSPPDLAADLADHEGRLALQDGEPELARDLHQRALEQRRRALGDRHPEVGSTLLRLATVQGELGRLDDAGRLAAEAVELYREGYGEDHPRLAVGLLHLGDVHYRRGDLTAAEAAQRRALELRETALGGDHLQTAEVRLRLANTLVQGGRGGQAREQIERAEAVFAAELGRDHPRMADVWSTHGAVLLDQGEQRLAAQRFAAALAVQERVYGAGHPWVAQTHYNLGLAAKGLGDSEEAARRFRAALAAWEDAYGRDHPLVGHALTGLGQALLASDRPVEAVAHLERALRLRRSQDTDPALVASTRSTLARALAAAGGDLRRARGLAAAARDGFREAGDAAAAAEVDGWLTELGGNR